MGQIERPARGFYAPAPPNPVFPGQTTHADESRLEKTVHSMLDTIEDNELRTRAREEALKEVAQYADKATGYFQVLTRLMRGEDLADEESQPAHPPEPASSLNQTTATTPIPEPASSTIDTTTPYRTETTSSLKLKIIMMTPEQLREQGLREASMDNHHRGTWKRL